MDGRRGSGGTIRPIGMWEAHIALGCPAPVMPRTQLIQYKRIIDRPVDRADSAAISQVS